MATNPREKKPRTSTEAKNHIGIPQFPLNDFDQYQEESKNFGHLFEILRFRTEFPYPRYKRLNFNAAWPRVIEFAETLPAQDSIRFFIVYADALSSIADFTTDENYRSKAKLALEFAAKLQNANASKHPVIDSHSRESIGSTDSGNSTTDLSGLTEMEEAAFSRLTVELPQIDNAIEVKTEESDAEFRGWLRRYAPARGKTLYTHEVQDDSANFQLTTLNFEQLIAQGAGRVPPFWWVSGLWKDNGEQQDITLPAFLRRCKPSAYPRITSNLVRALWGKGEVHHDAIQYFLIMLIAIALPDVYEPFAGRPAQAGLWPNFDGEWESIQRFAGMLAEHIRILYFCFSYMNYPAIRERIIGSIHGEPLPPETHAKVFIEACGDFWLGIYFKRSTHDSAILGEQILRVANRFEVYPCGKYEQYSVEKYYQLFRGDRRGYLNYVIKSGRQEIARMLNHKIKTEGPWIQPLDDELNQAARKEKREKEQINKTIKWCEIELEYLPALKGDHLTEGVQESRDVRNESELEFQPPPNRNSTTRHRAMRSSQPRSIHTKFKDEAEFNNWVERLYSDGKLEPSDNEKIPWDCWYSNFSTPTGTSFRAGVPAKSTGERICTAFVSEIDFVRWVHTLHLERTILSRGVPWTALAGIFVKSDGTAYEPRQLSVVLQKVKDEPLNASKD